MHEEESYQQMQTSLLMLRMAELLYPLEIMASKAKEAGRMDLAEEAETYANKLRRQCDLLNVVASLPGENVNESSE